jgi:hypothetical protein
MRRLINPTEWIKIQRSEGEAKLEPQIHAVLAESNSALICKTHSSALKKNAINHHPSSGNFDPTRACVPWGSQGKMEPQIHADAH